MDCECAVENDGSRHTVPDEIMNSSTPLHCLERDIAKRMHAKMQREIGEHDETSCEAKPPDRHLVAENARIYHLTPSPGRDAASYHSASVVWKGEGKPVDVRLESFSTDSAGFGCRSMSCDPLAQIGADADQDRTAGRRRRSRGALHRSRGLRRHRRLHLCAKRQSAARPEIRLQARLAAT